VGALGLGQHILEGNLHAIKETTCQLFFEYYSTFEYHSFNCEVLSKHM
jgi:hypothetical protein